MNFLIPSNTTSKISVFIIWLFHLCGMVGISYGNKDFFLAFTPINLFISFVLLFVNQKQLESKELKSAFLIFFIGMVSEILGVNYGLIFGDYVYLDNLGVKILGVPVLIGVNWIILTFITGSLSSFIFKNKYVSILMGAILMIGLDLLIEPVAPLLGFWIFDLQKVKRGLRARMKRHTQYRTHYETDKCLVCLFDTNEYQKKRVIRHFLDGSYSRISKTYVNRYFQKRNPDGTKSLN